MTDQRSPLDNALDLLVYAPVGLALTAAEELPKLAAKGRAQVQGQVAIARMVGQFAVAQGRKEIEKRLGSPTRASAPAKTESSPAGSSPAGSSPVSSSPAAGAAGGVGDEGSFERLSGRGGRKGKPGAAIKEDPGDRVGVDHEGDEGGAVIDVDFGTNRQAAVPADGLAIPGYDSLSASQVVQRLAGLSQEELAAVGQYEAAHRGRRTILTRVGQLKG